MGARTSKRLALLVAMIGLLGGGAYFARMFQVSRMARSLVARAEQAEQTGDYIEAVNLYRQHLSVVPQDEDVRIQYANALLKVDTNLTNQAEAMSMYAGVLNVQPNRDDVRRKLAVMQVERQAYEPGSRNLEILLQKTPDENKTADDGELEYLLGRCREALSIDKGAEEAYRAAVQHAPKLIDAYSRLAELLRDRIKNPQEADQIIEQMVKSQPDDHEVYLARGRYRRATDPAGAAADFETALKKKPTDPEIYVELARSALIQSKYAEARKFLEEGLKKAGDSVALYRTFAELGRDAQGLDQAIVDVRRGTNAFPDQFDLRWALANMLIQKGDGAGLLEQIEEMKKRNTRPALTDLLTANYYVMNRNWSKANQILNQIQSGLDQFPVLRTRVSELMAVCHGELGDAESQEADLQRVAAANPNNIPVRLELIQKLVNRGEINKAIDEYRDLRKIEPRVWNPLARLMIYRALYTPTASQNWGEIERLIDEAEQANPGSADPSIMRSELLLARGKVGEARTLLDQTRRSHPESLAAWQSLISLTAFQLNLPEDALKLIDQAKKALGDRIELRIEQARIAVKQGKSGSEALGESIEVLSDGAGVFSSGDQRKLVEALANEALRARCMDVAARLYSRCIENEPSNLMIRWKLLTLAFQRNDEKAITSQIEEIKKIEGSDHLMGTYADWWHLAWQAERPGLSAEEVQKKRLDARSILAELSSRRPDWAIVPLAYATLEEQELKEFKEKGDADGQSRVRESLINHYVQAINGGQREIPVVRRAVQLLFDAHRYDAADQVLRKLMPSSLEALAPDLKQMSATAVRSRDFDGALEIARKSVAAKPEDFRERIWLAEILRLSGRPADAELELRQAVTLAGGIADPWVILIQFLIRTDQIAKAESTLREAQAALPKDQIAVAMAQGQDVLAQAYQAKGKTDEAKARRADAEKWYLAAESERSEDPLVRQMIAAFFLKNGRVGEVQTRLRAILDAPDRQDAAEVAWARRTLALTMLAEGKKDQVQQALALFQDRDKTLQTADDRRVLIQVLLAQKDKERIGEAIALSSKLVDAKEATAEDRMLLAQLYRRNDEWPKAQEQYRELLTLQPENKTCLTRYAAELVARVKTAGSAGDADEAGKIIDKLKRLEPDGMTALALECELLNAQGRAEQAVALINAAADQPNAQIAALGLLCEKIGQIKPAEQLLRRWENQVRAKTPKATLDLAAFLGRNGRLSEAVDLCEQAQANGVDPQDVTRAALGALYAAKIDQDEDRAQTNRIADLIEKGIKANSGSPILTVALANLRERQERYDEAKTLYRRGIELGSKDGIPLNNLAWLTALQGGEAKDALDLINRAIAISGPNPDFLDTRGVAYVVAGESRLAIDDLEKAVAADASPAKLVHLAQAWSKAGDKEKAKHFLEMAKDKGLELKNLHPLEVGAYRRLLDDLAQK